MILVMTKVRKRIVLSWLGIMALVFCSFVVSDNPKEDLDCSVGPCGEEICFDRNVPPMSYEESKRAMK